MTCENVSPFFGRWAKVRLFSQRSTVRTDMSDNIAHLAHRRSLDCSIIVTRSTERGRDSNAPSPLRCVHLHRESTTREWYAIRQTNAKIFSFHWKNVTFIVDNNSDCIARKCSLDLFHYNYRSIYQLRINFLHKQTFSNLRTSGIRIRYFVIWYEREDTLLH